MKQTYYRIEKRCEDCGEECFWRKGETECDICGGELIETGKPQYYCECCKRWTIFPGADYGNSHYFCEGCLGKKELAETTL